MFLVYQVSLHPVVGIRVAVKASSCCCKFKVVANFQHPYAVPFQKFLPEVLTGLDMQADKSCLMFTYYTNNTYAYFITGKLNVNVVRRARTRPSAPECL